MKSHDKSPKISVVMPAYNGEKYISEAIESVLNQTFQDFEFIIVDDCSSDKTWDIIQEYSEKDKRIKAIKNIVNLGGCNNLNKGEKLSQGKYIVGVDNDDWLYPDKLEKQFSFMELHPDVGIVGGSMEIISENGQVTGKRDYKITDCEIRKKIFRYSPFAHPLIMIRKSILDEVGYHNPEYAPADDYELYFRIGKISLFANLPDVILKYRIVPGSMTDRLTKQMELNTIKVRKLYSKDNSYNFCQIDRLYNMLHYISIYIIPPRTKLRLFNLLRNAR